MLVLTDAIAAVESADAVYSDAVGTTTKDATLAAAIQAKLDAANSQIEADKASELDAAKKKNGALSDLIAAATAEMVDIPVPADPAA